MTASTPARASDSIALPALGVDSPSADFEAYWQGLVASWEIGAACAFADGVEALLDHPEPAVADRAADLSAYLSTFADGALIPNRLQTTRLDQLCRHVFEALGSTAPAPAPVEAAPAPVAEPEPPRADGRPPSKVVALPASARRRPSEARTTVCLLDVGEPLAPGLAATLAERGYQAKHFADATALEEFLHDTRPGALVLSAARLRSLPRFSAELGDAAIGTPLGPALIVVSGTRDLTHRLLAMRAGAAAFFGAPLDSYRIVSRIEELLGHQEVPTYRVLLVDADREHGAQCGRWLIEQGMTARLAFDARSALSAASEFRPDIALIDFDLPDARGFELTQLLHSQPEFTALPVVLYCREVDDGQRFDAIAAGADEVLVKPLKARHLIAVINSRVKRAQWLRGQAEQQAGRDPGTGLHLRQALVDRLSQRDLPPGAHLVFVGLDRTERIREAVGLSGLATLEAEIAQAFREVLGTGDVAAPLRDFAWLVLVVREHRDAVTAFAERLRQKLAERRAGGGDGAVPLSASLGITPLDDAETGVDARVARAEAAAMAAARVSGNRVLWYQATESALVQAEPELAVRAVLSRPWHESNVRIEFHPVVPLTGKLGGQFDFVFALVGTQEQNARADYPVYAPVAAELGNLRALEQRRFEACFAIREVKLKQGRQIRLFLPIAAESVLDDSLRTWLLSQMQERRLAGSGLTLELASAELLDRRAELTAPLKSLREAGVRLGLSDYGRDWAAVHVLNSLPVDFLRLDHELVLGTTNANAVSNTLVALVRKAHQLGAAVIAPSVDSVSRAHILLRLGIDYGVGEGLGRAVAEPEFDFNKPIW